MLIDFKCDEKLRSIHVHVEDNMVNNFVMLYPVTQK